ncbi:MAG: P-loop NTPase, partial [Bryobacterales bacterium]|nr:P-loop NTPase [Bryobacterales bacterium]
MPTPQQIVQELKKVRYPGFTRDIVSFGIIKDVEVAQPGVTVIVTATPATKPETLAEISAAIEQAVGAMPGVPAVKVEIERSAPPRTAATTAARRPVPGVRRVVAVASGKGGVGKSTVAVNLALALTALGMRTGLMDADVYGPSVAMMVGTGQQPGVTAERRIVPLQRFGLRYISMALFVS